MNLAEAEKLANEVLAAISPFCHQSMIVGSVRRKALGHINEIELVAIPRADKLVQLRDVVNKKFGTPVEPFPCKHTRIKSSTRIDIYWTTADCWGVALFTHTGPTDYVRRGTAFWGRVSDGGKIVGDKLYLADGTHVPTPSEEDVYKAMKIPFKNPVHRK